jgi:hypothetical protein
MVMHVTSFHGIGHRIRCWRDRQTRRKVDAEYRAFVRKLTALQDDAARLRLQEAQGHIGAAMRDIGWHIARADVSPIDHADSQYLMAAAPAQTSRTWCIM